MFVCFVNVFGGSIVVLNDGCLFLFVFVVCVCVFVVFVSVSVSVMMCDVVVFCVWLCL